MLRRKIRKLCKKVYKPFTRFWSSSHYSSKLEQRFTQFLESLQSFLFLQSFTKFTNLSQSLKNFAQSLQLLQRVDRVIVELQTNLQRFTTATKLLPWPFTHHSRDKQTYEIVLWVSYVATNNAKKIHVLYPLLVLNLYEIARTPQKISKDTIAEERQHPIHSKRQVEEEMRSMLEKMQELNIQMKAEADQIRSSGSAATEQIVEQYEGLQTQIRKLTDISQRHEDEIEDLRCISDYTHELVLDRENRESATKMIVKAWPRETSYYDRTRITDWLVEKAGVQNVKQEHGYYTQSRKFQLSPVSILTFADQDDRQRFERFAYTSFSGKFPLYYWNEKGDYVQHHKGGRHRLIITNYISKTDLTLNLTLTTVLHILTTHDASPYKGQDTLSHRPTDKQIYNFRAKQVVAKTTYDRDQGIAAIVLEKGLMDIVKEKWHEGWKEAHKDHPRFSNYIRYPYAISFAEARLEDERQEIRSSE